ncbi:MAG: putative aspartyl protease [Bacteroidetes bacterium]|nr:MAG: putative aspartyl protease [Bacteroidota bacterium]
MKITLVPIQTLNIENDGFHLMTKGLINGIEASFLIDTGASRTVFDQTVIRKFINDQEFEENEKLSTGLGTNSMPSQVAHIDYITLGELTITDYTAIVIDLTHVHQSYQQLNLPDINCVLGGDILKKYKAVINYKTKSMKLYY